MQMPAYMQDQYCAVLSMQAYSGAFPYGFEVLYSACIGFDEVSVLKSGATVFVVCTGSDDTFDWLSNMFAIKKRIGKIRIHRGFHNSLKRVKNSVKQALSEAEFEHLVFTGHSRGAAIAQLLAWFFSNYYKVECCTFASPRVGNKFFADSMNERVPVNKRFVVRSDIVCTVPKINYVPAGTEILLPKQKGIAKSHSMKTYLRLVGW